MTGPIQGRYTARCEVCAALAYSSDEAPPADRDGELTRFADARCPRGGVGCTHTTEALQARDELRPGHNRPRIGVVTALTAAHAVVDVDRTAVNATRGPDALTVGNSVVVQRADGQWVVIGIAR